DEHASAPQVAQFAHRGLSFFGKPHEPLAVVLQDLARVGEGAALRRAVEQLLAEVDLEAADRLADRRLRAVHFGRRTRETALLGDREKRLERRYVHKGGLLYRNDYHFDF